MKPRTSVRRRRRPGRVRRVLVRTLALAILLLLALGAAVLRTAPGRARLEREANRRLGALPAPWTVRIDGLGRGLPFRIEIAQLRAEDGDGAWLELDDVRVRLDGRALLAGRVRVRALEAGRTVLHRLPESPPAAEPVEPADLAEPAPPGPPALSIAIERMNLPSVTLGAGVPGGPAEGRIEAEARLTPVEGLHARLLAVRRDPVADARAHVRLHWPGAGAPVRLWAEVTEADGGWIGRMSPWLAGGLHAESEVSLRPAFAHGTAVFRAGELGRGRLSVRAERDAYWRVAAEGSTRGLRAAGLELDLPRLALGADFPAEGPTLRLSGEVRAGTDLGAFDLVVEREGDRVRLSRFRVVADDTHLYGAGEVDLASGLVEGRATLGPVTLARPPVRATLLHLLGLETWPFSGWARIELGADVEEGEQRVRVRADLRDLDTPAGRLGEAAADVTLRGPWSVPAAEGSVDIRALHPAALEDAWPFGIPALRAEGALAFGWLDLTLRAEAPGVEVEAWLDTPLDAADLRRGLPWHAPHPFQGRVATRVRIDTVMDELAPDLHGWRGHIEAEIRGEGAMNAPRFDGRLALRGGRIEIPATGAVVEGIRLTLVGEADTLRIEEAEADDGRGGRVTAEGHVRFPGLRAAPVADLHARFDRLRLVDLPYATAALSGDVRIESVGTRHRLGGQLEAREADIRVPSRLPPQVPRLRVVERRAEAPPEPPPPLPWFAALDLDLGLRIERARVRGRGLDSEWRGRLQAGGTAVEPRLEGNLAAVRGRLQFLGRRFRLEEARVDWSGPLAAVPVFQGTATSRAGGILARIEAVGPATEPVIRLESDPPLPEDEILARILFGRSLDRLSPLQALRFAHGLHLLHGGAGAFDLLSHGQDWLQLDRIEIEQDEDDARFSAITVGRYVGDRIYVEGAKGLGGAEDRIAVEVELTPSITLETETSPGLREGIRLRWSRDY